jgi:phosphotransferase system IIB component
VVLLAVDGRIGIQPIERATLILVYYHTCCFACMKRTTILCTLLCLLSLVSTTKAQGVKLTIKNSGSTYQINIGPGTNTVDYDKRAFQSASSSLCPGGVSAYLKNDKDVLMTSYSSAWASSQIFFDYDYVRVQGTNDFVSDAYDVSQILNGVELCMNAAAIRKIQIRFHAPLRVNGVERVYTTEADWTSLPPELLKTLKARAKELHQHRW